MSLPPRGQSTPTDPPWTSSPSLAAHAAVDPTPASALTTTPSNLPIESPRNFADNDIEVLVNLSSRPSDVDGQHPSSPTRDSSSDFQIEITFTPIRNAHGEDTSIATFEMINLPTFEMMNLSPPPSTIFDQDLPDALGNQEVPQQDPLGVREEVDSLGADAAVPSRAAAVHRDAMPPSGAAVAHQDAVVPPPGAARADSVHQDALVAHQDAVVPPLGAARADSVHQDAVAHQDAAVPPGAAVVHQDLAEPDLEPWSHHQEGVQQAVEPRFALAHREPDVVRPFQAMASAERTSDASAGATANLVLNNDTFPAANAVLEDEQAEPDEQLFPNVDPPEGNPQVFDFYQPVPSLHDDPLSPFCFPPNILVTGATCSSRKSTTQ